MSGFFTVKGSTQGVLRAGQTKVYPPVGKCIYCGKAGGIQGLSREHIIPFGLGGSLILPKASCAACRAMTGAFEETCLRVNFLNFRVHSNMPTRRPKERPTDLPVNVKRDGVRETIRVAVEDHPDHLILPVFDHPGIFTNTHLPPDFVGTKALVIYFEGWPERVAKLPQHEEVMPNNFHFDAFVRMLAKIGHGYAVAELGLGAFKPLLPDLISWRDPNLARYLIGGMDVAMPVTPSNREQQTWTMYQIALFFYRAAATVFIVVRLRLFPHYPMVPQYAIVAGETTPELEARYGLFRA